MVYGFAAEGVKRRLDDAARNAALRRGAMPPPATTG